MTYSNKLSGGRRSRRSRRTRQRRTKRGGKYNLPLKYFSNSRNKSRCKLRSKNRNSNYKKLYSIVKSLRYKPKKKCKRT